MIFEVQPSIQITLRNFYLSMTKKKTKLKNKRNQISLIQHKSKFILIYSSSSWYLTDIINCIQLLHCFIISFFFNGHYSIEIRFHSTFSHIFCNLHSSQTHVIDEFIQNSRKSSRFCDNSKNVCESFYRIEKNIV